MKIVKIMAVSAILAGAGYGVINSNQNGFVNAQASSWKSRTPKIFRGTYRTHRKVIKTYGIDGQTKVKVQNVLHVNKNAFYFLENDYNSHNKYISNSVNFGILHGARYIKIKKNFYKISGYNSYANSGKTSYYVKRYNGKKLKFSMNKALKKSDMYYRK